MLGYSLDKSADVKTSKRNYQKEAKITLKINKKYYSGQSGEAYAKYIG